ncbi:MAG: DUF3467 domain-containing protein [Syntrophobacteraceae bacterium]
MQNETQVPQQRIKSEQFKALYINSSMMKISFFDVAIVCGRLTEEGTVEDLISLTMSPEHAKALMIALTTTVKKYEDTFGEIKTQPIPTSKEGQ